MFRPSRRRLGAALIASALTTMVACFTVPALAAPTPDHGDYHGPTRQVTWLIPGPGHQTTGAWPETLYDPNGATPECGDNHTYQVDRYRYDTPEQKALVDSLIAAGILHSPAEDSSVVAGWQIVTPPPCLVVPVAPVVTTPTCDMPNETITVPVTEHVTYHLANPTPPPNVVVPQGAAVLTATPDEGYALDLANLPSGYVGTETGAALTITNNFDTTKCTPTTPPPTSPPPTTTPPTSPPATPPTTGSTTPAPSTPATTTTVTVSPSASATTTVALAGYNDNSGTGGGSLANTGSPTTSLTVVALLALAAGTGLIFAGRRRGTFQG